jgi:hypothetical protein
LLEPQSIDAVNKGPPNYFFKGFLVWYHWGHVPNVGGAIKKLSLFTEAKIPTSFGRKTLSRGTIKAKSKSKTGTKVVTTLLLDSNLVL